MTALEFVQRFLKYYALYSADDSVEMDQLAQQALQCLDQEDQRQYRQWVGRYRKNLGLRS